MTSLSEYERMTYVFTLEDIARVPNMLEIARTSFEQCNQNAELAPHSARVLDLHDPAKLAALFTSEARRCGVDVYPREGYERPPFPCYGFSELKDGVFIARWIRYTARDFERITTVLQAHTVFAKLLQLPNDAREDAERALRSDT